MIVVDCGLGFPEDDMYGVDLVIADTTYLEKNQNKCGACLSPMAMRIISAAFPTSCAR